MYFDTSMLCLRRAILIQQLLLVGDWYEQRKALSMRKASRKYTRTGVCLTTKTTDLRPWQTRTHRCGHIVADTNVSPFARTCNICCGHKFCVRDSKNVSDFVQKHFVFRNILCPQQMFPSLCSPRNIMGNNVSSFTRAFKTFYASLHLK